MSETAQVTRAMIIYEEHQIKKINHFLKVYGFAKTIAELEGLGKDVRQIIEIAALTHDIGIKISLEKYQSSAGPYQEKEGPAPARKLLSDLGYADLLIERVCWLIGHHHTCRPIGGIDHQILIEADFLVNAFESQLELPAVRRFRDEYFQTAAGTEMLNQLYQL